MGEPKINVDKFIHRPAHHVVGLLGTEMDLPSVVADLGRIGVPTDGITVLCGERGAEILDQDGRHHGLRARVVRGFQRLGYDETTLAGYDEALRDGALLLHVPAKPGDNRAVAHVLWRHGVQDIGYFGSGTFEQFRFRDEAQAHPQGA
jgi:hypothetical protein